MKSFAGKCLDYLKICQNRSHCGGLSFGLLQNEDLQVWLSPYPETTGYAIPTLFAWGEADRALQAADWLAETQHPDGWIPAYARDVPAAFDTAAALLGWLAAQKQQPDLYDQQIERATGWLSSDAAIDSFTDYYEPEIPGYFARIAWPLKEADAPQKIVDRYLAFADNKNPEPRLHFDMYTIRGLWETGEKAAAKERLKRVNPAKWICVPAAGQKAVMCFKAGLNRLGDGLLQWLRTREFPLHAADPPTADYLPGVRPNWAAKFALDAIKEKERCDS